MVRYVRALSGGATLAAVRFPVSVLLIAAFSLFCNLERAGIVPGDAAFVRLSAALSGAIAISIAVALALEGRIGNRLGVMAVAGLTAAAISIAIERAEPFAIYAPALVLASVLTVPLVPSLGRGSSRDFWTFTLWCTVGVVLAFVSVVLFVLGVFAILEMVRYLFQTQLFERFDRYLLTTAFTLVGPLFALGRIPRTDWQHSSFEPDDRLVRTVRPLFEWVLAPLVLATALVLHVYVARIAVTGEVPRGQIGWIVATFALLVLGLRLAVDPFEDRLGWPTRMFRRGWIAMLVIPQALLAYALGIRVAAEGVTAERYYLGLWGLAAALVIVAQIVPRMRGDTRAMAAIPIGLLAASTFGPWGVADVVGRSQTARIAAEFGERLASPRPDAPGWTIDDTKRLESRLFALESVDELGRIRGILDSGSAASPLWEAGESPTVQAIRPLIGLDRRILEATLESIFVARRPAALEVGGFDLLVSAYDTLSSSTSDGLGATLAGAELELVWKGVGDRIDLRTLLPRLSFVPHDGSASGSEDAPAFDVVTRNGRHVRIWFENVVVTSEGLIPERMTFSLALRSGEWARGLGGETTPPPPPTQDTPPPATR